MKSFKQFLGESLDRSFPYKYHGEGEENTHEYSFSPGKRASKIRVSIIHNDKKRSATVNFHREDGQETATGEHPRTAAKVFGTVAKIVKEHGKKHRSSIDNINFSAAKSEPSRVSLYRRITKRLGGKETEPNKTETNFTVPNLSEMKKPRYEVPAEPGSTPTPEGKIKLYHQTGEKSLNAIRRQGIQLSKAKGYEGPKAIYASPPDKNNRGFYGRADDTPTAEFHVDKDEYRAPFVHRDEVPAKDITAHKEWHATVRYIDADPELKAAVLRGEHDNLMKKGKSDKFAKAVRFVKKRAKAKK